MQLPPTILSVDKREKRLKSPKGTTSSSSKEAKDKATNFQEPKTEAMKLPVDHTADDSSTSDESDSPSEDDALLDEGAEETPSAAPGKPEESKKKRPQKPRGLRPPRSLETTLFDRLEKMYGPGIKRMLTVQYRYVGGLTPETVD